MCDPGSLVGLRVQQLQYVVSLGPLVLLNEPRTVCLQPVLQDACHVCCKTWGVVIKAVQICQFQTQLNKRSW